MDRSTKAGLAALLATTLAVGCTPAEDAAATSETSGTTATQPARGGDARSDAEAGTLTDANLQAYARALRAQAEVIRRPGRGTHYGVTMTRHRTEGEAGEVLAAAGMTIDEYRMVHEMVNPVLTTLNFQGEIGPPRSINLEMAPEWKERLEGDPFGTLPSESAAALRRNMDDVAPAWSEVIGLTAQHGQ